MIAKIVSALVNWQAVTEKDVRDWLNAMGDVEAGDNNGNKLLRWVAQNNETPAITVPY